MSANTATALTGVDARRLLGRHRAFIAEAQAALDHHDGAAVAVAKWVTADELRRIREELARIDSARLGEMTDRNLRLAAIQAAGYLTAADLIGVSPSVLQRLPGVGEATARGVVAAIDQLAAAALSLHPLRIGVDRAGLPTPVGADRLLALLHRVRRLAPLVEPHRTQLTDYLRLARAAVLAARPARHAIRMLMARPNRRRAAHNAIEALVAWESMLDSADGLPAVVANIQAAAAEPDPTVFALVADFTKRAAEYYTTLAEIAPAAAAALAVRGLLPEDLVTRVTDHPLDTSGLRVVLRGYQEFGAKFALQQGRVLLGDEMGLGKTIQALAVMAHLAADGHRRFLVVCPASLLGNWEHEVRDRSALPVHRLHGVDRTQAMTAWEAAGGAGVTTFEGLSHLGTPSPDIGLLVVDEAQQAKNPKAARTRAVAGWAQVVSRVLLLSGTPMDNRIEDFVSLTEMLHPGLSASFPTHLGLLGPEAFRRAVSHVYLRRNQSDVLIELPEVIASDDWVDLGGGERRIYRQA
ncbi:MAG: SNF2-related protein, partial [Promicromonosporaceae bacterium]|nr:SNF2-related protein [Promicromonosporaceae bacterium]